MLGRKACRCICIVSGVFFLLAPAMAFFGLIKAVFPNGEWLSLDAFGVLFGGRQEIVSEGSVYSFSYSLNPFYVALLALSFVASLASFFGVDSRKNLLFSFVAGFFALLLSAMGVLTFHWVNPGFPLDGLAGGVGFALGICFSALGILSLIPSLICAFRQK